jgi:hypothetical protein
MPSAGRIRADPALGLQLKDVAKCFGRDTAIVSSWLSRYSERMAESENLRKQAARVAKYCQIRSPGPGLGRKRLVSYFCWDDVGF